MSLQPLAFAIVVMLCVLVLGLVLRWWLGRRERALLRLLDAADQLEGLLQATRQRMGSLKQVVAGRVPEDIGALARASLDGEAVVQQGLRNLLEHRLWIARHGETASQAELDAALQALQRARDNIAVQLSRLERAGADLTDATQAALEQAAREPPELRRGGQGTD